MEKSECATKVYPVLNHAFMLSSQVALLNDLLVQDRIKHRVNLVLNVLDDQAQALAFERNALHSYLGWSPAKMLCRHLPVHMYMYTYM